MIVYSRSGDNRCGREGHGRWSCREKKGVVQRMDRGKRVWVVKDIRNERGGEGKCPPQPKWLQWREALGKEGVVVLLKARVIMVTGRGRWRELS